MMWANLHGLREHSKVSDPGQLGQFSYFKDVDFNSTSGGVRSMLSMMPIGAVLTQNTTGAELAPSLCMDWDPANPFKAVNAVAAGTDAPAGIVSPVATPIPNLGFFYLIVCGPAYVTADAALAVGAGIGVGDAGQVTSNAAINTFSRIGRMLEASTAGGDVRRAHVDFQRA